MRLLPLIAFPAALAFPAAGFAMTHAMTTAPGAGMRAAPADPAEGLERLAAAATRGDRSNAKPAKSIRNILKNDPYLRAAYASLDNK